MAQAQCFLSEKSSRALRTCFKLREKFPKHKMKTTNSKLNNSDYL